MRKYLTTLASLCVLLAHSPGEGNTDRERLEREEEYQILKGAVPSYEGREEYVEFDTKKVRFTHRKHQNLIKEIGEECRVCHHKRRKGKKPRACKRCHAKHRTVSKGKYARVGQKLNQKDIFHLLCNDCHKKMFIDGYKRKDGSRAQIPIKCHQCHSPKKK